MVAAVRLKKTRDAAGADVTAIFFFCPHFSINFFFVGEKKIETTTFSSFVEFSEGKVFWTIVFCSDSNEMEENKEGHIYMAHD